MQHLSSRIFQGSNFNFLHQTKELGWLFSFESHIVWALITSLLAMKMMMINISVIWILDFLILMTFQHLIHALMFQQPNVSKTTNKAIGRDLLPCSPSCFWYKSSCPLVLRFSSSSSVICSSCGLNKRQINDKSTHGFAFPFFSRERLAIKKDCRWTILCYVWMYRISFYIIVYSSDKIWYSFKDKELTIGWVHKVEGPF